MGDPNCKECDGTGSVPQPALAIQEQEAKEGKRKWMTKVPCKCIPDYVAVMARLFPDQG